MLLGCGGEWDVVKKNNNINCMLKADSCLCEEKIQHKQEERKQEKVHRSTKRKKEGGM